MGLQWVLSDATQTTYPQRAGLDGAEFVYFESVDRILDLYKGKIIISISLKIPMGGFFQWISYIMGGLFDFLPGVNLIPDRIRKIIASFCFIPGAILTSIGWAMDQSNQACSSCSQSITDGALELLMMVSGASLMFISLCLWPWDSYEEEPHS